MIGIVFFDQLPSPPGMMPLFRYRKLVTEREEARNTAAREERDRLRALLAIDRWWLATHDCDVDKLIDRCTWELMMCTSYR